jgi:TonB family protein
MVVAAIAANARVLAVAPDAHRYAKLLLNVGAKQSGLLLMPALAEERTGLERRLHMLAKGIVRNRWKAAGLLALGAVLTVIACESRLPNEPQQPTPRGATSQQSLERKREGTAPQEPDAAALIQKYYPPLLREAGIGGVVGVEATVRTSGAVDNYRIVKSSGHDALDQAALRVVKEMKLMPYRVPVGQQPKDEVRSVYLYFNPKPSETRAPDATVLPPMKDITDEPVFTPYTEQPELQNRSEVGQSLVRNYPPTLRDAGIGGRSMVWLLLDERGQVINVKLKEGSGHEAIDAAAMRVAREMRFTPARNRGAAVKVWIVLPIVFKTN